MPPKNSKILERIYRLISLRQRSEKEIRDYFKIKNLKAKIKDKELYSELVVETTIQKLKELRLVDDEQFARSWVESRSRKKGMRVIRQELFQKGISREIIEKVYSEQGTVDSELETAEKLLEKKLRIWKDLEPQKFKQKAYDFLMRRGFEYEVVKDVVEKLIKKDYN